MCRRPTLSSGAPLKPLAAPPFFQFNYGGTIILGKFNKLKGSRWRRCRRSSTGAPAGRTHEGAPGYARDAKGELFLFAVSNMAGEDTFYEAASGPWPAASRG